MRGSVQTGPDSIVLPTSTPCVHPRCLRLRSLAARRPALERVHLGPVREGIRDSGGERVRGGLIDLMVIGAGEQSGRRQYNQMKTVTGGVSSARKMCHGSRFYEAMTRSASGSPFLKTDLGIATRCNQMNETWLEAAPKLGDV
jgi:hypothetical protein